MHLVFRSDNKERFKTAHKQCLPSAVAQLQKPARTRTPQCTHVNAGDISAVAKIRNLSQRSLCGGSIEASGWRGVTLKDWW